MNWEYILLVTVGFLCCISILISLYIGYQIEYWRYNRRFVEIQDLRREGFSII